MTKAGTREGFIADLISTLANDHGFRAQHGPDTDVVISSNPVDARWGMGSERAEYAAAVKVAESERSIYFWEQVRGRDDVAAAAVAVEDAEDLADDPAIRIGPGTSSWEYGHGTLRRVVEDVASRHGFLLHPVLARNSATW